MGHYDIASKHLVRWWPDAVLSLLFPGSQAQFVEHGPTELPQVGLITDRVMRIRLNGREQLLHLEIQTEWTTAVPARVADYRTRFRFAWKETVSTVVLCLAPPDGPVRIEEQFVEGKGRDRIEVGFRVVKAWEQSYSWDLLQRTPGLVPLAVLSTGTTAEDLGRLGGVIQGAALPHEDKRDLQAILGVMAGLRGFPRELLRAILEEDMVHEHPILKEWEERARSQGLEQGLEQGELHLVRRLLAKLGIELEPELDARLSQLGTEALEELADELVVGDRSRMGDLVRQRLRG
jgi:hypothetical protein